jgi:hypothetical protein
MIGDDRVGGSGFARFFENEAYLAGGIGGE